MFASLKNKIKEETGSDVATTATNTRHINHNNNRIRSRFSSTLSVNSTNEDTGGGGGSVDSQSYGAEQLSTLRSQCNELTTKMTDLTTRLQTMQEEKTRIEKTNEILLETVKVAQTQKDIYCEEQEKIQNLQQSEIEKLKNLLSFREQEAVDRLAAMRQNQQQIENLTTELERLKQYEPMVEDLQETLENETKDLKLRISTADERFSEYATNAEHVALTLRQQNSQLQEQLNEAQNLLETEKEEKLTALLRNAEISQSEEILRKELRMERVEANELHEKNEQLTSEMATKTQEIKQCKIEMEELKTVMFKNDEKLKEIDEMQREISEKNKTIKILNQRLADLKKTLQKEFQCAKSFEAEKERNGNCIAVKPPTTTQMVAASVTVATDTLACDHCGMSAASSSSIVMDEVNFKYLKHVIVKFLTSREVEARHLIRAVATLLKLTKDEEKLLQDTLNWKMSWFGSKPNHGRGQHSFSIPPS
uniref:Golgin subfamily A member 1 n=1 Tax=Zeugodacus cucurbitae TaxID=28588 RepID=A0A0A1WF13_ZEUCU